ncbi:hypothetical protein WA026_005990 [Henosepilachna vigintioctopunctata]|uniref:Uncharacterized protein n=1 Tax=Henosepilachna vigintioctopunctata TaxID=420089 RepID=A0AAW1U3G4_9CUCU
MNDSIEQFTFHDFAWSGPVAPNGAERALAEEQVVRLLPFLPTGTRFPLSGRWRQPGVNGLCSDHAPNPICELSLCSGESVSRNG